MVNTDTYIKFLVFAGLIYIHKDYIYKLWHSPKPGTVIILNGPSAAGKSTLQKSIQRLACVPYLSMGIDDFFNNVCPDEYGKLGVNPETDFSKQVRYVTLQDNTAYLHVGPEGEKIIHGMHKALAAYAQQGCNLIIDYIMYNPEWMKELLHELKDCPVYLIGVTLPLDVLEKREQAKSTSPIVHARSHYDTVHTNNHYDLWIDTSITSADQGAEKILQFIAENPR